MQDMGISTIDAPTGLVSQFPIRLWFAAPELSHFLFNDNHDRPLHPLMGPFIRKYLSMFESIDDGDDGMRHLNTGLCETRLLACSMLEDTKSAPTQEQRMFLDPAYSQRPKQF